MALVVFSACGSQTGTNVGTSLGREVVSACGQETIWMGASKSYGPLPTDNPFNITHLTLSSGTDPVVPDKRVLPSLGCGNVCLRVVGVGVLVC